MRFKYKPDPQTRSASLHKSGLIAICILFFVFNSQMVTAQGGNQQESAKQPPDKDFKDWAMRCDEVDVAEDGTQTEKCYIYQNLLIKETGERLFKVAVGYSPFHDNPLFLMTAPLGMYLPGGIRTQVDDKDPRETVIERCNPDGCHAAMSMDKDVLAELRQGRWLNISILDGNLQEVRFKVSLIGFTAGFKAIPVIKPLQKN